MSAVPQFDLFSTFGFHSRYTVPIPVYVEGTAGCDAFSLNILNILGYFPVLGLIPCAVRLIVPLCDEGNPSKPDPFHHAPASEKAAVKVAFYTRGFLEGIGLGCLYIIPDLCATGYRFAPCTYSGRDPKNPDPEFARRQGYL